MEKSRFATYGFKGKKHKPESNIKRSETIKNMYKDGKTRMGWKSYESEELRRRGRLSAQLKNRYGINMDIYDEMFNIQNGKCYICLDKDKKLHVDHNHETGKVRKLLCRECNQGIGFLKENPEVIQRAYDYIMEHS